VIVEQLRLAEEEELADGARAASADSDTVVIVEQLRLAAEEEQAAAAAAGGQPAARTQ
jgi:hypothetical protein